MTADSLNPARIVVIDDEEDVLLSSRLLLKQYFSSVETYPGPEKLPDLVRRNAFDVLLLDMNFALGADDGAEGLTSLTHVLALDPQAVVVLITAHGDIDLAVTAMKRGALDFIVKPWDNERLVATVLAAANSRLEATQLREPKRGLVAATHADSELIGTSQPILRVRNMIERAAPTDANVLVLGENGCGKELVAREIHRRSARAKEVFLRIDLGALSPLLFESELFGHRRGAFTDAKEDRTGLFRAASGGTLFLDEIGNVPVHLQSKLLTALERREVVPLGTERVETFDVRVICATNLSREKLSDPNLFRQDLLYRIRTVEISVPPLRERRGDIPLLLEHFIALYAQKYNFPVKRVSAEALERLMEHTWPGNVRELRHAVESAVIMAEGTTFQAGDFSLSVIDSAGAPDAGVTNLGALEKATIVRTLERFDGNVSHAAKALGLTRTSLYRRMGKYGL